MMETSDLTSTVFGSGPKSVKCWLKPKTLYFCDFGEEQIQIKVKPREE